MTVIHSIHAGYFIEAILFNLKFKPCFRGHDSRLQPIIFSKGSFVDSWRKVISLLQELRDKRGMMVILVAHAKVERFEDPENAAYDRYTPRLHKHAASLIAEWVDAVLFANKKFRVTKENAGFNGERAIAAPIGADGGERIIRTVGSPACIAKNRYGLPSEIPLSWQAFIEAYTKIEENHHE